MKSQKEQPAPSVTLREIEVRLRRLAIAEPKLLPIAENIERIAVAQAEYEKRSEE